jgi:predicted nucleic acid-binding Zn ribbon protein
MPTFDYVCPKCGLVTEKFLSISAAEDRMPSECLQTDQVEKICLLEKTILTAPEFRLKGKGWYESDFKNSATDNVRRVTE